MGSLIFSPFLFLLLSVGREGIFISVKLPWWGIFLPTVETKKVVQRSYDMWAREGLESKWDLLASSRTWSGASNYLADELSISVWIICRHLQLPSGSGAPCSNYKKHHYSTGTYTHAFRLLCNMIKSVSKSSCISNNQLTQFCSGKNKVMSPLHAYPFRVCSLHNESYWPSFAVVVGSTVRTGVLKGQQ